MEYMNKYFSFHGCVKRKEFFYIFVVYVCLSLTAGWVLSFYLKHMDIETISQLIMLLTSKSMLLLFLTLIWLPAIVKRLHDIGTSGFWSLLLIPAYLLDFRNILLFKEITKLEFTVPLSAHYLNIAVSLIFLIVLFFMPSSYASDKYKNPNKALNTDSAKDAAPVS